MVREVAHENRGVAEGSSRLPELEICSGTGGFL